MTAEDLRRSAERRGHMKDLEFTTQLRCVALVVATLVVDDEAIIRQAPGRDQRHLPLELQH